MAVARPANAFFCCSRSRYLSGIVVMVWFLPGVRTPPHAAQPSRSNAIVQVRAIRVHQVMVANNRQGPATEGRLGHGRQRVLVVLSPVGGAAALAPGCGTTGNRLRRGSIWFFFISRWLRLGRAAGRRLCRPGSAARDLSPAWPPIRLSLNPHCFHALSNWSRRLAPERGLQFGQGAKNLLANELSLSVQGIAAISGS